jgi:hypothetical protein
VHDQLFTLVIAAIAGATLYRLWAQDQRVRKQPDVPAHGRTNGQGADVHAGPSPRGASDVSLFTTGSYADLATRVIELESRFKLLSNEWTDKESRIDAILKRVHRLRKLEEERGGAVDEVPQAAPMTAPEMRAAILRKSQQGG